MRLSTHVITSLDGDLQFAVLCKPFSPHPGGGDKFGLELIRDRLCFGGPVSERVAVLSVDPELVVQMRARRKSSAADITNDLTLSDP